jgi:hypothetical protein
MTEPTKRLSRRLRAVLALAYRRAHELRRADRRRLQDYFDDLDDPPQRTAASEAAFEAGLDIEDD